MRVYQVFARSIVLCYKLVCRLAYSGKLVNMINQYELAGFLEQELPEYKTTWQDKTKSPYTTMQALLQVTSQKIEENDFKGVKKCLKTVSELHERGNNIVKNAVENIYIYSFANLIYSAGTGKAKLFALVPITLYTLYINQLKAGGC